MLMYGGVNRSGQPPVMACSIHPGVGLCKENLDGRQSGSSAKYRQFL